MLTGERRRYLTFRTGIAAVAVVACAVTGVARAADESAQRTTLSPARFSAISSGVALIETYNCAGKPTELGTGFLLGSSVLMTARHVLDPPDGPPACKVRAKVGTQWVNVFRWVSWRLSQTSDGRIDDLATLKLATPVQGHVFEIRNDPVPIRSNLAMVGHPLGNQISLTQGRLLERKIVSGVPLMAVNLLGAEGASGSALVDDDGRVVGILQKGLGSKDVLGESTAGVVVGVDLSSYWSGNGIEALCRAYPLGGIPRCQPTAPRQQVAPPRPPRQPTGIGELFASASDLDQPWKVTKSGPLLANGCCDFFDRTGLIDAQYRAWRLPRTELNSDDQIEQVVARYSSMDAAKQQFASAGSQAGIQCFNQQLETSIHDSIGAQLAPTLTFSSQKVAALRLGSNSAAEVLTWTYGDHAWREFRIDFVAGATYERFTFKTDMQTESLVTQFRALLEDLAARAESG